MKFRFLSKTAFAINRAQVGVSPFPNFELILSVQFEAFSGLAGCLYIYLFAASKHLLFLLPLLLELLLQLLSYCLYVILFLLFLDLLLLLHLLEDVLNLAAHLLPILLSGGFFDLFGRLLPCFLRILILHQC